MYTMFDPLPTKRTADSGAMRLAPLGHDDAAMNDEAGRGTARARRADELAVRLAAEAVLEELDHVA
jgi:hypothetical protein